MGTSPMEQFLSYALPPEIAERFDIVAVDAPTDHALTVTLEERNIPPNLPGTHIVSKGFVPERTIFDFPLRDRAVTLSLRRRRWRNATTGAEVEAPLTCTAPGTSYEKSFGAFLKGAH